MSAARKALARVAPRKLPSAASGRRWRPSWSSSGSSTWPSPTWGSLPTSSAASV